MITTLRESKTKLSALIALAQAGEEVIITVRGKPKARLSAIRPLSAVDISGWKKELKSLHRKCGTGKRTAGSPAILNQLREERS
ncbi:MAG: type II toxin-antitoxin system prevent-host-death family antitoxin [PVC group bacterium]